MRRSVTDEPAQADLTGQQEAVLAALLTGNTITAAASDAGIARQTVHRWLANNAEFIAAYNRGRHQLANSHATRILAMCGAALDVLDGAIAAGDAKVALAVLKGAGVFAGEAAQIVGSDDVDEVRNEQKRRAKAQELQNLIAGI
jgi:transposase-like protein